MSAALLIDSCGMATSLQDRGRLGAERYGVSPAGAMDRPALALANALVGNDPGEGAIEMAVFGAELRAEGLPVRLALAGAESTLEVGGRVVPHLTSALAEPGQPIRIRPARGGIYAYLAVGGGFDIAPTLGSLSLHLRSRLGGLGGRLLKGGDRIPLKAARPPEGPERFIQRPLAAGSGPIRVVLGPQDDMFEAAGIETFLSAEYRITTEADRMGLRLAGPKIAHAKGFNIVSDGIVTGAIQVPGSGTPIILMADRQTTGGYPKIAVVATADIPRLGQMRPGSPLRFTAIPRAEAIRLARASAAELAAAMASITPVAGDLLTSERLLALNLAGEATDGAIRD